MSGLNYIVPITGTSGPGVVAFPASAAVIMQLTTSAACPITINRIELQSGFTTSAQAVVSLQWGYYSTATSTNGFAATPTCLTKKAAAISSATAAYGNTATMGGTFAHRETWQWNLALPFDMVFGMDSLKIEVPAANVWALIFPSSPGSVNISGTIYYTEY